MMQLAMYHKKIHSSAAAQVTFTDGEELTGADVGAASTLEEAEF